MSLNPNLSPHQIIALLAQLRQSGGEYPIKLLAARRAAFMEQAARLNLTPQQINGGTLRSLHAASRSALQPALQWGLAVLAVALIATAGVIVRNVLINSGNPEDGGATSSQTAELIPADTASEAAASLTATLPTPTPTGATSTPTSLTPSRTPTRTRTRTATPVNTQVPGGTQGTDSGWHYGQTKTPKPPPPTKLPKP